MLETSKALKFLEHFSIITVGDNKVPNFLWTEQQNKKLKPSKFKEFYEYKGGIKKKDGDEIVPTTNFGIVTGYDFLEVLDVDLKVLSTTKEKEKIWDEMLSLFKDAIFDFDDKFVIYKTQSEGFHILYKTKRVEGNLKISKLKGHKEALIETRGKKGYVFAYPDKKYSKKSYFEIEFISDEDRESLMRVSKSFNYEEPKDEIKQKEKKKFQNDSQSKTPWEDFDEQTDVWDVVCDEFTVVKDTPKRIFIKRLNATSAHSGYIYKDDNLLYLFSTGTIYPHEKQISPSSAFAYKYHNGDFSASAKELYEQGFGERIVKKEETPEPREKIKEIKKEKLVFPIEVFPEAMQNYMIECNETLESSIDYLGSSLLWTLSVCIGNSFVIQPTTGWNLICNLWIAVVGKPGIGKTPSLKNMIFPLQTINNRLIKVYIKKYKEFEVYDKLSKKEKDEVPEIKKPVKTQFIVDDITIEALFDLHQESDNAVGVFKDELVGWVNDMNKYKEGSDKQTWLSTWSGESVMLNRVSRMGSFVNNPFIPVIGGIQPKILDDMFTDENKDSGFMDRVLISYPDVEISEIYIDEEMSQESLNWYSDTIINFYQTMVGKRLQRNYEGDIEPYVIRFDAEAKNEWKRIYIKIRKYMKSDEENEYMKSMYPKQTSYTARFALILHVFKCHFNGTMDKITMVDKESLLNAEKLSEYFISMAKKVKIDSKELSDIKESANSGKVMTAKQKFKSIYKSNPDVNITKTAEVLGVSRTTIHRYIKELDTKKD